MRKKAFICLGADTKDSQKVLGPCTLEMSRNCAIISQDNLRLPFFNVVPVCLSLQNRSILSGPPSTPQQRL